MLVYISFEEIRGYITEHYKKKFSFSRVSEKELCVTFIQRVLIKHVHIDVKLHIDEVKSDTVVLTYKGGMDLDMIISKALDVLMGKMPELSKGVVVEDKHRIRINLSKIEKAKAVMKTISLRDIEVKEKGLSVSMALK